MGLNPEDAQAFISVYLDDILIFSRTLEEHLDHLQAVLQQIVDANLKLKLPSTCLFAKKGVPGSHTYPQFTEAQSQTGTSSS